MNSKAYEETMKALNLTLFCLENSVFSLVVENFS